MKKIFFALALVSALLLCAACGQAPERPQGELAFALTVTYEDGSAKDFTFASEKATLGEALLDAGFVEVADNGVYVTVDGVTADFDKDGAYWALYIGGEYAMTGPGETILQPDTAYEFRYEKWS